MADLGIDGASPAPGGDLESTLALTSGRMLLAQDLCARLTTPTLWYDPGYGYDLRLFLNGTWDAATEFQCRTGTQAECLKDDRVQEAAVGVTFYPRTSKLLVKIELTDGDGPFTLTLEVTSVTVEILKLEE